MPISFSANLVQSAVSGSKTVTKINGKTAPAGSYTSYQNWFNKNGKVPLQPPKGDIQTWWDNLGKYQTKNYRVSKDKTETADIITTTLHLSLEDEGLQQQEELKEEHWPKLTKEEEQKKMESEIMKSNVIFRRCPLQYMSVMIDVFKAQQNV